MKKDFSLITYSVILAAAFSMVLVSIGGAAENWIPNHTQLLQHKKLYDDPSPYLKTFGPKQVMPKEQYEKLAYDINEMKAQWADVVGFKAPDLVNKIHPEVKPGKYTYKDVQNNPAFKDLMPPLLYERIKPGAPPLVGNIPEFEIIPTKQYYYALPVAKATKENAGKTKQDAKGYLIDSTWISGIPFPRPAGPFKAMQVMYNHQRGYYNWQQERVALMMVEGYDKSLKNDFHASMISQCMSLAGRIFFPPYGWYDERAAKLGEYLTMTGLSLSPRDVAGTVLNPTYYLSSEVMDSQLIYLPMMRRVKKMSSTDTQDPIQGQDLIYDDNNGFFQKMTPNRYPYKYEVIAEREYLIPTFTDDGSPYVDSKKLEIKNIKFERRPMYVVKMTQLDPNYVYSKRILYLDKESFILVHMETYDQKGRLYRSLWGSMGFFPEMGMFTDAGGVMVTTDHLDKHSGWSRTANFPVAFERKDCSMETVFKKGK